MLEHLYSRIVLLFYAKNANLSRRIADDQLDAAVFSGCSRFNDQAIMDEIYRCRRARERRSGEACRRSDLSDYVIERYQLTDAWRLLVRLERRQNCNS